MMPTALEEAYSIMNYMVRSEVVIKEADKSLLLCETPYGDKLKFELIVNDYGEVEEVTFYCNDNYISTTKMSALKE